MTMPYRGINTRTVPLFFRSDRNQSVFTTILDEPNLVPANAQNVRLKMIQASIWNDFENITTSNNRLQITRNIVGPNARTWTVDVLIPPGQYEVLTLEQQIQNTLFLSKDAQLPVGTDPDFDPGRIRMDGQAATQKIFFYKTEAQDLAAGDVEDIQIRFVAGSPTTLLGFEPDQVVVLDQDEFPVYAPNTAEFNVVNSYRIRSSLVGRGFLLSSGGDTKMFYSNVLAQIPKTAKSGFQNVYVPAYPVSIPANELAGQRVFSIRSELLNEKDEPVTSKESWEFLVEIEYQVVEEFKHAAAAA